MSALKMAKLLSVQNNGPVEFDQEKLPHHVIADHILPRLPVKSLLRFKTVRKNWLSTISTPAFRKIHLEFSSLTPNFLLFHVDTKRKMFLLSYDESKTTVNDLVELRCNELKKVSKDYYIVDSCNGLVCLHLMNLDAFSIWNPATNQYKIIPDYTGNVDDDDDDAEVADEEELSLEGAGFGYSSPTNDYKILALYVRVFGDGSGFFYLFSMNSGTWTRLEHLDGTYYPNALTSVMAVCIDDTLYWPISNPETRTLIGVVGFDLVHDQMQKVLEIPWIRNYTAVDQIFKMKGCFSMCCRKDQTHFSDVWMLKQQGGSEIWSKLFTIDGCIAPALDFTVNGKYLVQHSGQLKLIDPAQQEADHLKSGAECEWEILGPGNKYVESLISF